MTGFSSTASLSQKPAHLFSDLAVHHMGSNLADGVNQGGAGPDEFRTAPLWGVGQRLFFLHDGRTTNLLDPIEAHASDPEDCTIAASAELFRREPGDVPYAPTSLNQFCGSEANHVIANFNAISATQKQDILNFLRSL